MKFICTECPGTKCTIHDYPQPGLCLSDKNGLRHACSTVAPKWCEVKEVPEMIRKAYQKWACTKCGGRTKCEAYLPKDLLHPNSCPPHEYSSLEADWHKVKEEPVSAPCGYWNEEKVIYNRECSTCKKKDEEIERLQAKIPHVGARVAIDNLESELSAERAEVARLHNNMDVKDMELDRLKCEVVQSNKLVKLWSSKAMDGQDEIEHLKAEAELEAKRRDAFLHWKQLEIDKAHAEIERLDAESANWEETAGRMSDRASRLFGELEEKGEEIGRLQNDVKIMTAKHERIIQALERLPGFSECRFLDDVIEWIKTLEPQCQMDVYGTMLSHDPEARAKLDKVLTLLEKKKPAKKKKGAKK